MMVLLLGTAGCDDDGGTCLDDPDFYRYISLDAESLPPGRLGETYEGILLAEIQNELDDDAYDYEFDLRSGMLPPGLGTDQDGNRLILIGVPTEAGTFTFEIEADAESEAIPEPECLMLTPVREEFTIVIDVDEVVASDVGAVRPNRCSGSSGACSRWGKI